MQLFWASPSRNPVMHSASFANYSSNPHNFHCIFYFILSFGGEGAEPFSVISADFGSGVVCAFFCIYFFFNWSLLSPFWARSRSMSCCSCHCSSWKALLSPDPEPWNGLKSNHPYKTRPVWPLMKLLGVVKPKASTSCWQSNTLTSITMQCAKCSLCFAITSIVTSSDKYNIESAFWPRGVKDSQSLKFAVVSQEKYRLHVIHEIVNS